MEQKTLSVWLRVIIIIVAVCGLAVYAGVIPLLGESIVLSNPEFDYCFIPWLWLIEITAIPCFTALVFGWRIAANIGHDRSFLLENAELLRIISMLAIGDAVFFFIGNIAYLFVGFSHPGIVLVSLVPVFIGISIAVAAAVVSRLVKKAAHLQEQSDLTI